MEPERIALIPAYQPAKPFLALLKEAKSDGFVLLVVDDGSDEKAQEVFQAAAQYGTVLTHAQNKGKGRAIKTGLSYIQAHFPADCIVVTMDADGQHQVSDAKKLCEAARRYPESLILGSRTLKGNVPIRSRVGNTVTRFVFQISTGQKIWDTQTGLRAFRARLIPELLAIQGERYEYEMNVLLSFSRVGIPIREVAIDTIYLDDNASSHFDTLKDSCRIYKEILKFSAASLISFSLDYGLYSLLACLTEASGGTYGVFLSNIGARLVSAAVNYALNRKLVFKSDAQMVRSLAQYAVLACGILAGNTLVLGFFVEGLHMNRYVAKLVTETIFFLVSWLIQRNYIFGKNSVEREKESKR